MKVTRTFLRAQVYNLAIEHSIKEFKGSYSWATSFMQRFKFSLWRTTKLTTLTDPQLIQQSVD